MINKIKRTLWLNLKNIPGWRSKSNKKILVIEADDYGSIRMPSREVYAKLLKRKIINEGHHDKYDNLETPEDLLYMFQVLKKYKDVNGNYASVTPFFNPCNPDIEKIKASNYKNYSYLNYKESLENQNINKSIIDLWEEGIHDEFFKPQYHGREHLNVPMFMDLLQAGNKDLHIAVDYGFYHPNLKDYPELQALRPAYYFKNVEQKEYLKDSIVDGINNFKETFGFKPTVFCPSNGHFHDDLKIPLSKNGIKTTVESGVRYVPNVNGDVNKKRKFIFGRYDSNSGTLNYFRNVIFEPIANGSEKSIKSALIEIESAFRWGKPAVVATHRTNYSGGLYTENREKGLEALDNLLQQVVSKWPDVQFMNSNQLAHLLHQKV